MKPEWMLTDEEIIELIEQLEELEPQSSLSKWIAKHQGKKLLEYLLNQASAMNLTSETIINVVYVSKMLAMRKELEASQ